MLNRGVKSQFGSWNKDKFVITTLWPFFPKVNLELISFQDFSGIFFHSDKTKKHTQDKKQMLKFTGHLSMYIIYLHVTVKAEVWPRSKHIQWNRHCGRYSASCVRYQSPAQPDSTWAETHSLTCWMFFIAVAFEYCVKIFKNRKDYRTDMGSLTWIWGLTTFITPSPPCQIENFGYPAPRIQEENRVIISPQRCQRKPNKKRKEKISKIYLHFLRTYIQFLQVSEPVFTFGC